MHTADENHLSIILAPALGFAHVVFAWCVLPSFLSYVPIGSIMAVQAVAEHVFPVWDVSHATIDLPRFR